MSIEVSKRAIEEAQKVMQEQKMEEGDHVLRVGVAGGGCSGFQYSLTFDEVKNIDEKADMVSEFHGVKVVVDKKSDLYLDGTTVDFHEGLDRRGFVFNNPQAQSCCGCGSSFSA